MRKKLTCIILSLLMLVQCVPLVYAAQWTDSVAPNADMEVKRSDGANFVNGPVTINGKTAEADFKVTLDMKAVFSKFVEWYETGLTVINNMVTLNSSLNKDELISQLNALEITGEFTVVITYPAELEVPEAFIKGGNMYGFSEIAKKAFYEISRTPGQSADGKEKTITIVIGVTDANSADGNLYGGALYANKNEYLAYDDGITLTAEGVYVPDEGTYTAIGTLTGYTETTGTVGSKNASLRVDYKGVQTPGKENSKDTENISATVILEKSGGYGPSSSGGGGGSVSSKKEISFNIDGEIIKVEKTDGNIKVSDLPKPEKDGYTFDGWYFDGAHKEKVETDFVIKEDITLYGHWISNTLDSEDHFAYVIGYPDGTVRPQNNITREEVATIFYRLLREDKLISIATDENNFIDVEADRWSNKAISSLANGGYIKGYEDGSFRPGDYITRAEFATMATRYAQLTANGDISFTDTVGHWAEEYVKKAAGAGWVTGYEDGTFGPEKYITRAEVMTIINRMLVRYVDEEGLHKDTKFWIDMDGTEWYYYNVLEATNFHDYERKEDGKLERWTGINENKIWVELDEMENAD